MEKQAEMAGMQLSCTNINNLAKKEGGQSSIYGEEQMTKRKTAVEKCVGCLLAVMV